jgi:hypothetical protein
MEHAEVKSGDIFTVVKIPGSAPMKVYFNGNSAHESDRDPLERIKILPASSILEFPQESDGDRGE